MPDTRCRPPGEQTVIFQGTGHSVVDRLRSLDQPKIQFYSKVRDLLRTLDQPKFTHNIESVESPISKSTCSGNPWDQPTTNTAQMKNSPNASASHSYTGAPPQLAHRDIPARAHPAALWRSHPSKLSVAMRANLPPSPKSKSSLVTAVARRNLSRKLTTAVAFLASFSDPLPGCEVALTLAKFARLVINWG